MSLNTVFALDGCTIAAAAAREKGSQHVDEAGLDRFDRCIVMIPTKVPAREFQMLKFIGGTIGVIFIIGLLVVIGILALIF